MLAHLLLATSVLPQSPETGLLLEERLLATIPEGTSLDFPAQSMGGARYQRPNRVHWSADGRRVAYIGIRSDGEHPVIDNEVLDAYDFTAGPEFCETGSRVVFVVGNQKNKRSQEWWLLVDGKEIYEEDWIGGFSISPDGEAVACWTQPGAKIQSDGSYNNGGQTLVLLEDKGRKWKDIESKDYLNTQSIAKPIFTLDSKRVFSFGGKSDFTEPIEVFALQRGKKKASVEGEVTRLPETFAIDKSGKHWGVSSTTFEVVGGQVLAGSGVALLDGEEIESDYEVVNGPFFSPLDDRIAYRVRSGKRYGVALENMKAELDYDFVWPPIFGPKDNLAFVAGEGVSVDPAYTISQSHHGVKGGHRFVVRRSKRGELTALQPDWLEIRGLVFSPDGKHLAFAGRTADGWEIVLDGQPGPIHEGVGNPRFADDSETLLYGSRDGAELWWRVWSARPTQEGEPDNE